MATDPVRIYKHVANANQKLINRNHECPQVRGIWLYDEERGPDIPEEQQRVGIFESAWTSEYKSLGDMVFRTIPHGDKTMTDLLTRIERPDIAKEWHWNAQTGGTFAVGCADPTIAGIQAAENDDATTWTKYTGDGISASAGPVSAFTAVRRAHNPTLGAVIRTPATISDLTFWVGFVSATPTNDTGPADHVAFRYSTNAPDAGWLLSTRAGGGTQTLSYAPTIDPLTTTPGRVRSVIANTKYTMIIKIDNAAGKVLATIDGGREEYNANNGLWEIKYRKLEVSASLPAASQDLGVCVRVISGNALSPKSILLSRLFVQHQ